MTIYIIRTTLACVVPVFVAVIWDFAMHCRMMAYVAMRYRLPCQWHSERLCEYIIFVRASSRILYVLTYETHDEDLVVSIVVYGGCFATVPTPLLNARVVPVASRPQFLHFHRRSSTMSRSRKQPQSHRWTMGDIKHEVSMYSSSRGAQSFASVHGNIKQLVLSQAWDHT